MPYFLEIYLADTPYRRNAQHFGGGSEQLRKLIRDKAINRNERFTEENPPPWVAAGDFFVCAPSGARF